MEFDRRRDLVAALVAEERDARRAGRDRERAAARRAIPMDTERAWARRPGVVQGDGARDAAADGRRHEVVRQVDPMVHVHEIGADAVEQLRERA
jgi:hypothetical protein